MTSAQTRIRDWRENIRKFAWDNFKFEPDAGGQAEALDSYGDLTNPKKRISLQACTGPGKTATEAICGWYSLSCFAEKGEHPKGAAISVTAENLKLNLWPELRKWQERSEFLMRAFEFNSERITAVGHKETWQLAARSFQKRADPTALGQALAGVHSKFPFFLIDESGEIPLQIAQKADQAFSTADVLFGRIIQAGNPTSLEGMLYAAATTLRHLWHVIIVTGDPDDPRCSPRIDKNNAREQIKTWGRDNPWVRTTILGLFPEASINALLGVDEVVAAMSRHLKPEEYEFSQKRLGIDVARMGNDRTVLAPRQGLCAFKMAVMRSQLGHDIAARALAARERWGQEIDCVDGTGGFGASTIDSLIQAGIPPIEYQGSSKPIDPRFYNKRAEVWWNMAQWVKRGAKLPNDPELVPELTVPTYSFKNGKLIVEEKEQIKKRLGRSPDKADALSTTFTIPDLPARMFLRGGGRGQLKSEYDPLTGAVS